MSESKAKYWAFLTTMRPNVDWDGLNLQQFDLEEGTTRLVHESDSELTGRERGFERNIFITGVKGNSEVPVEDASDIGDRVVRYFLGMVKLARGVDLIEHEFHSHTILDADTYTELKNLDQSEGSVWQFFTEIELAGPKPHERTFLYPADRFLIPMLEWMQPNIVEFLNHSDIPDEEKEAVKDVLGFNYNAGMAGTKRQEFLSEYTAVDFLVRRIGRGGGSKQDRENMKKKLIEHDILSEDEASAIVERIASLYQTRSDVYFGGKEPSDFDSMPGLTIGIILRLYLTYHMQKNNVDIIKPS